MSATFKRLNLEKRKESLIHGSVCISPSNQNDLFCGTGDVDSGSGRQVDHEAGETAECIVGHSQSNRYTMNGATDETLNQ